MRFIMEKKIMKEYIFEGFGFPVVLHNVQIDNFEGEEYPELDYKELEFKTVQSLIASPRALTGNQLKFLRKFMKRSLRDIASDIEVSHAQIKNWEDRAKDSTGMGADVERRFKNFVLTYLIGIFQKSLSDVLITQTIEETKEEAPLDPYEVKLKYG